MPRALPGSGLGYRTNGCSPGWTKPGKLRFDVVNLFDTIYEIGGGSGIGGFAPQFGPRRGFYVGIPRRR
jgi:hypothetical protein